MSYLVRLWITLTVVGVCPFAISAFGQTPDKAIVSTQVTHQIRKQDSFQTIFSELTKQAHINIVCESVPYHSVLSIDEGKTARQVLDDSEISVDEKVKKVAIAFDYDAQKWGDTFVLTKRYSAPFDIPEVTLDEALQSCRNFLKAVEFFNPHQDDDTLIVRDLLNSASVEEEQQLTDGITVSSLRPPLQTLVVHLATTVSLGRPLDAVERVVRRLSGVKKANAYFYKATYSGLTYPAYTGEFGPNGAMWSVVLGYYMRTDIGGGAAFFHPQGVTIKNGLAIGKFTDPTTPDKDSPLPFERPAAQKTLAEMTALLNSLPVSSSESKPAEKIEIDSAVARKTVSLFQDDSLSKESLIQAILLIYGLRIVHDSETTIKITLPAAQPVRRASAIADTLRRLLPASFLRATTEQAQHREEERRARLSKIRREQSDTIKPSFGQEAMLAASLKRLRTLVEPLLDATEKKASDDKREPRTKSKTKSPFPLLPAPSFTSTHFCSLNRRC